MNWRVKGVVQGLLSAVPGGGFINNCLQTTLGNLRDFEANVVAKAVGTGWSSCRTCAS